MKYFEIEKGIPVPKYDPEAAGEHYNIIFDMKIGDSFVVKTAAQKSKCQQKAYRKGLRLMSRTLKEDGFRLWRVK